MRLGSLYAKQVNEKLMNRQKEILYYSIEKEIYIILFWTSFSYSEIII